MIAAALPLQLEFYRALRRIRILDERMQALQRQGRIGFYGTCTGQEAVPVALGYALEPSDWVFPRCAKARCCSCVDFRSRLTWRKSSVTRKTS